MKEKTGNPDFEYEIACDQMCGNNHYTMRGVIKVVSQADFILWRAKQKSAYSIAFPPETPKTTEPVPADTTGKVSTTAAIPEVKAKS